MSTCSPASEQTGSLSDGEPPQDQAAAGRLWRLASLLGVLLLSLALRLWNLAQNELGNEYYAACVRSMTLSWHNFLYNSFDPAGFVSVDKPPVALWVQAAAAKLFGFNSYSLFIPQVLEGVASVWIVYHLVQRRFGPLAGSLAALFMALTPVSVAIDRSNNTDSLLVLVLLLAAWAITRAAEEGNPRFLVLSLALIGLGFNVKMLAAFVVLPTFVLVYCLGAPLTWRRRFKHLAIGATVLMAVSLSWIAIFDLTAPEHRPFAGTTKKNSMLELAVGPYAVGRFVSPLRLSETYRRDASSHSAEVSGGQATADPAIPAELRFRSQWARLFVQAPTGPFRLADGRLSGQVGWLVPLAAIGLAILGLRYGFRKPIAPAQLSLILWFGWAATYGVVYSFAGGIMHLYYLATMAPALSALAGIGAVALWDKYAGRERGAALLPATLLATAAWQLYIETSSFGWKLGNIWDSTTALLGLKESALWLTCLHAALPVGTCVAALSLFLLLRRKYWNPNTRVLAGCAFGLGLTTLLVLPAAWASSSVLVPGHGILPSADLARLVTDGGKAPVGFPRRSAESISRSKLVAFLVANRVEERFLLATMSARGAAPIIASTGHAVMAVGGFHGLDPILTPKELARMVETGQIRFVMLGDLSVISRKLGADLAAKPIMEWVRSHGKLVDPGLWRSRSTGWDRLQLFDLRPDVPLVPAP